MEYSIIDRCLTETKKWDVRQAEIRVFSVMDENLTVKNGQIERANQRAHRGINLSVIGKEGARGLATSAQIVEDDIPELVKNAVKVAKASASKMRKEVELTEEPIIKDEYITGFKHDPFETDFEEKLAGRSFVGINLNLRVFCQMYGLLLKFKRHFGQNAGYVLALTSYEEALDFYIGNLIDKDPKRTICEIAEKGNLKYGIMKQRIVLK